MAHESARPATSSATAALFAFSSNKHPIGAVPAIYSNGGQQFAVVASGGCADPTAMSWTTSAQYLIAARRSSTGREPDRHAVAGDAAADPDAVAVDPVTRSGPRHEDRADELAATPCDARAAS